MSRPLLRSILDSRADIFVSKPFPFSPEDAVQEFVIRWINITDSKVIGWVDAAIREDNFQINAGGQDNENDGDFEVCKPYSRSRLPLMARLVRELLPPHQYLWPQ